MTGKETEDPEWLQLYEFWKDAPTILEVDEVTFNKIALQEFRGAILDILRIGVLDDYAKEKGLPRRHAMSAPEMLPYLKEKLEYDVRLSNVYFHLEKLENAQLIRKIAKRLEEKHYITYYGRTSKLIIHQSPKDFELHESKEIKHVYKLSKIIKGDFNEQKLNEIVGKISQRYNELYEMEKEWIKNNHDMLFRQDIDVLEFYGFIANLLRGRDSIFHDLLSQFYKELGLEIYSR
ncbi:MAG: hypothetical protein ACFFCQ_01485 [Promethearchaeota archaeon]